MHRITTKTTSGRQLIGLERMLRMYVVQQCFNLDESTQDAIYYSQAIRQFIGSELNRKPTPYATMLLKFRRLLEKHQLTKAVFDPINLHLMQRGCSCVKTVVSM